HVGKAQGSSIDCRVPPLPRASLRNHIIFDTLTGVMQQYIKLRVVFEHEFTTVDIQENGDEWLSIWPPSIRVVTSNVSPKFARRIVSHLQRNSLWLCDQPSNLFSVLTCSARGYMYGPIQFNETIFILITS